MSDTNEQQTVVSAVAAKTSPTMDETNRDLMLSFCSIGNNCEFGQAQRIFKAEPIDIFRWASTDLKVLIALLDRRFEDIGNPAKIEIKEGRNGEYMVHNTAYRFGWHAFADKTNTNPKDLTDRESKRLPYLARKFIEDIQEARRIFVIKAPPWLTLTQEHAAGVLLRMESYGSKPTLMFVSDGAEIPRIETVAPRLLHGHVVKFADGTAIPRTTNATDWLTLCRLARDQQMQTQ